MPPRKPTKKTTSSPRKKNDALVTENLRRIYENPDGSLPDMKIIAQESTGKMGRFLTKGLFFLALLGVGYFAWQMSIAPRLSFNDEVAVAVAGTESVAPGELVTYTVRYRNPGTSPMVRAELYFEHQNKFVVVSSSLPFASENKRISLGELASKASGEVTVTGRWVADFGVTSTLTTILSYSPQNFSSVFEKKSELVVVSNKPAVNFSWTMPAVIKKDRPVVVGLLVRTIGPLTENQTIKISPPAGFSITETEPVREIANTSEWKFSTSSTQLVLNLKGVFTSTEAQNFKAEVKGTIADKQIILGSSEQSTAVVSTAKESVTVTVLDKTDTVVATPGTVVPITVSVTNQQTESIENAQIVLSILAPSYQNKSILQWQKLTDPLDGVVKGEQVSAEIRRGQILWSSKELPDLKSLAPGETITLSVSIPIKDDSETALANFAAHTITVLAELRKENTLVQVSDSVEVIIASDAAVVGTVQKTTSGYDFVWLLTNSFHELTNVKIEADLYGEFAWDPAKLVVPVGKAMFDSKTKKLVWDIPKLPTNIDSAALKFSTTVNKFNATQTDVTGKIKFTATDAVTKEVLNSTLAGLKTPQ